MDGREWWFEQRKPVKATATNKEQPGGIYFRPLHGRHWAMIGFQAIYDLHIQQFPMPI
jgi:hypothetical protein